MAIYLLYSTLFVMFFQPVFLWPALEPLQPLRNFAIAALLMFMFSNARSKVPFLKNNINRYFLFFVIWQTISSAMIWMGAMSETFNLWLRMGIVYYLITQSILSEKQLRGAISVIVISIIYLAYYSISLFVMYYIPGMRAGGFGWFENANDLAIILVSVIPLALLLANTTRSMPVRAFYIGLAGVFAFNILFTGSRNGLLGLLTVGLLSLMSSKNIPGFIRSLMMAVMIGAVATVGVANVLSRSDLNGLSGDESSEDRLEQWKAGMRMVAAKPVFGVGRNEFAYNAEDFGGVKNLQPHNTIVQVVAETGLPGGIAFLLFSFVPLLETWRLVRKPSRSVNPRMMVYYQFIAIAIAGFWVCAFFSNRYQFYILYVLVALSVAVRTNLLINRTETPVIAA